MLWKNVDFLNLAGVVCKLPRGLKRLTYLKMLRLRIYIKILCFSLGLINDFSVISKPPNERRGLAAAWQNSASGFSSRLPVGLYGHSHVCEAHIKICSSFCPSVCMHQLKNC